MGSGCRFLIRKTQKLANLWQRGGGGGCSNSHQLVSPREVVPQKWFYVRLDDHIRLLPPGQVGVALDNREGPADHICGGSRVSRGSGFQEHRDDHIRPQ